MPSFEELLEIEKSADTLRDALRGASPAIDAFERSGEVEGLRTFVNAVRKTSEANFARERELVGGAFKDDPMPLIRLRDAQRRIERGVEALVLSLRGRDEHGVFMDAIRLVKDVTCHVCWLERDLIPIVAKRTAAESTFHCGSSCVSSRASSREPLGDRATSAPVTVK